jgi:hypothetical protein
VSPRKRRPGELGVGAALSADPATRALYAAQAKERELHRVMMTAAQAMNRDQQNRQELVEDVERYTSAYVRWQEAAAELWRLSDNLRNDVDRAS